MFNIIKSKLISKERTYLFLDEIQKSRALGTVGQRLYERT